MQRPTAVVLIIIDGLSDISSEATCNIPTLTKAACRGRCGLIDPVAPGLACGSDTAHLSIFGYNPHRHYRGRGAFEALGAKIPIRPGDVAFKCNLACIDSEGIVTSRRPARGAHMHQLAGRLCRLLDEEIRSVKGVDVMISHAGGHRCIVRLSGDGLSDSVNNTDPLVDNRALLRCEPDNPKDLSAVHTADVVNRLSDTIRYLLARHVDTIIPGREMPAVNVLLMRGAAMGTDLIPFEKASGLRAFLIAPTKIIAGVGRTAGIDIVHVEGATGGYDTDLMAKAEACVEMLMKKERGRYLYDLSVVHVKAVDEAAHEKSAKKKAFWLEQVDLMTAQILRLLRNRRREDVVLCVTGDHTSPSEYGDHTCEPVPFLVFDAFDPDTDFAEKSKFVGKDECNKFCSTEMGANGSLGRFPGNEIPVMIHGLIFENSRDESKREESR